jgi:ATP phosphoribosyltransferase
VLVDSSQVADASLALTAAGLGPVTASRPEFVFDVNCHAFDTLKRRVI